MCDTCGCNLTPGNRHLLAPGPKAIGLGDSPAQILNSLLQHNDRQAALNRARLDRQGVFTINLMSSPGSGKTALLEASIRQLAGSLRIAVIEGDLETENDALRIRALGVPAQQIVTGTACHLDAHLTAQALDQLDLQALDVLFIENVGNLVCPASFDLGHHRNIALLSVTEGDDKPAKYPVMFRAADLMLITKTDLLPYLEEFSPQRARAALGNLASPAQVIELSSKNGAGMATWLAWLKAEIAHYRELRNKHLSLHPRIQAEGRKLHQAAPEIRFRPVVARP
jgi:hydrogenase nickel incorporation protein HypB